MKKGAGWNKTGIFTEKDWEGYIGNQLVHCDRGGARDFYVMTFIYVTLQVLMQLFWSPHHALRATTCWLNAHG